MRMRLKGINSTTKRLANGSKRTYWYAWKGGPALRGEPGTPEFVASYNEACNRRVTPPTGKLLIVLRQYQDSEDFTGLAKSTRRSYVALIKRIEQNFADFPLSALTDPGVVASSRNGATVSRRRAVDGKPTMPGPY
jgi:hypothetical protein